MTQFIAIFTLLSSITAPFPQPLMPQAKSSNPPVVLAENQTQTRSQGHDCDGESQELGIAPIAGGFLELPENVRHIRFERDIALCAVADRVEIIGTPPRSYSCEDIRDSADEGVGVDFLSADGTPHHLWLHINPENSPQALEIGLYRQETEVYWIVSKIAVCAE